MNTNVSSANTVADVLSTYSGNAIAESAADRVTAFGDTVLNYTYFSPYDQILERLRELQSDIEEIKESLRLLQSASLQKVEELV